MLTMEIFEGLTEEASHRVAEISRIMEFKEGDIIIKQGDKADKIFTLLEGEVEVFMETHSGKVSLSVIDTPYQSFGWSALVPPNIYTASVICRKDSTFAVIQKDDLETLMEKDPSIGFVIYKKIANIISKRLKNLQIAMLKSI